MTKILKSRTALMAHGAVLGHILPLIAADKKIDLSPAFAGLTKKNFAKKKAGIVSAVEAELKGKLAQDADAGDLAELLDALETVDMAGADEMEPNAAMPLKTAAQRADDEDPGAKAKAFMKERFNASDEDMSAFDAECGTKPAEDAEETDEEKAAREAKEKAAKDAEPKTIDKPAMDKAIKDAVASTKVSVLAEQRAIREAEAVVRPHVGELAIACDSAADVYKLALDHMGVELTDDVPPSAYRAMFAVAAKAAAPKQRTPDLAIDAKGAKSLEDRFPGFSAIAEA